LGVDPVPFFVFQPLEKIGMSRSKKPNRSHSPSTRGTYNPGVGITITRANIENEQARRAYEGRKAATPSEIVLTFVTEYEQNSKEFRTSKRFDKLVNRATAIMRRDGSLTRTQLARAS
jgi:hypothetical protein